MSPDTYARLARLLAAAKESPVNDLMLLSNSFSPGQGALEHAMDALAALFADCRHVLFVPYAGSNPDACTEAMREILATLGVQVTGAHRAPDPLAALAEADAVFTGGGNAFRLLRAVQRNGLLPAIAQRVRAGMPYLGVSAGGRPMTSPTWRRHPLAVEVVFVDLDEAIPTCREGTQRPQSCATRSDLACLSRRYER